MFGTNVVNEVSNLNNDLDHEVVDLIDADEAALKLGVELIETPDTESDICIKLIDCENVSESTHFSEPDLELDLIDFRDSSNPEHKLVNFSNLETEFIDFSDTEPELDYTPKPIDCKNVSKNTNFSEPDIEPDLIAFRESSKPEHKPVKFSKFETDTDPKLGIFFKSFSQLSRVKVAKYNLGIKKVYFYFVFFTLYLFSGAGAKEFKQRIETRWDEERAKTSSPSQTWLIPQPRSNSNSIIK